MASSYVEMGGRPEGGSVVAPAPSLEQVNSVLTDQEVMTLQALLSKISVNNDSHSVQSNVASLDSEYPEFHETTHAWAVFADNPQKRAGVRERVVGTLIIVFQLFTYYLFAAEAIEDYQAGSVVVKTTHANCVATDEQPEENFTCEAEFTNPLDAFVAFFMLGIFLTSDFLQAVRVIRVAPMGTPLFFACLAGFEVVCAYIAACISISFNLYIGEVTDAIEVGVGLLFIRDLSQRTYAGIRYGKQKQYGIFFGVLITLVTVGMLIDPLCEHFFAAKRVDD